MFVISKIWCTVCDIIVHILEMIDYRQEAASVRGTSYYTAGNATKSIELLCLSWTTKTFDMIRSKASQVFLDLLQGPRRYPGAGWADLPAQKPPSKASNDSEPYSVGLEQSKNCFSWQYGGSSYQHFLGCLIFFWANRLILWVKFRFARSPVGLVQSASNQILQREVALAGWTCQGDPLKPSAHIANAMFQCSSAKCSISSLTQTTGRYHSTRRARWRSGTSKLLLFRICRKA